MDIDDGSTKPLGHQTDDGELEVREENGEKGYHETELGQHMRWMRQAPDLFEKYQHLQQALTEREQELQQARLAFRQLDKARWFESVTVAEWRKRAEAAEHALIAAQAWQSIETAPKDGTTVIGFDASREYEPEEGLGAVEFMRFLDSCWLDPATHTMKPTHWMPLPDPPKAAQEEITRLHQQEKR